MKVISPVGYTTVSRYINEIVEACTPKQPKVSGDLDFEDNHKRNGLIYVINILPVRFWAD